MVGNTDTTHINAVIAMADSMVNMTRRAVPIDNRIDSGDTKLKEHLENVPRNATYRSKTIQNENVSTDGAHIISKLSDEIKCSRLFYVFANEVTACRKICRPLEKRPRGN